MPAPVTSKVSWLLNGGIDEQGAEELRSPGAQQGSSPTLAASRNTRFSAKRGSCVRAPDVDDKQTLISGTIAHALVPDKAGRTAVYADFFRGSQVMCADGDTLRGTGRISPGTDQAPLGEQTFAFPAQITDSGAIGSAPAFGPVSSLYDPTAGLYWFAYVADTQLGLGICLSCMSSTDGTWYIPERVVMCGEADLKTKVGLTLAGTQVYLWYQKDVSLYFRSLTLPATGSVPTLGTASAALFTGLRGVQDWDVCDGPTGYCFVVARDLIGDVVITYNRVNMTTAALDHTAGFLYFSYVTERHCAISYRVFSGVGYVLAAWSSQSNDRTSYTLRNATTGAEIVHVSGAVGTWGRVATGFGVLPEATIESFIVATSVYDKIFSSATAASTIANCNRIELIQGVCSTGAVAFTLTDALPWYTLHSRIGTFTDGDYEYPVFLAAKELSGSSSADPGNPDYVADPSLLLIGVRLARPTCLDALARFGSLRFTGAPARARTSSSAIPPGHLISNGSAVLCTYKKAPSVNKEVYGEPVTSARYVKIDTAPTQPAYVQDREGAALVACSLPMQWDGAKTMEIGAPLYSPHVVVDLGGFLGATYPAGTYSFRVVQRWVDATGLEHRSAPSLPVSATFDGLTHTANVVVPEPVSFGSYPRTALGVETDVYVTPLGSATYHLVSTTLETTDGVQLISCDLPDTASPQLYAVGLAGEEILPQPPPPLRDIAVVGARVWGLDAEYRSRLVCSKLKAGGRAFEFAPALEAHLPPGAGEGVALREVNGTLVIFTTNSIWQLAGEGPNNTGTSGGFSAPAKVSDVGCLSRQSVLSTPAGIVFQDPSGRFSLLAGSVQRMPGPAPSLAVTGAFLLESADEACFVIGDEVKVWNYAENKWSTWALPFTPTLVTQSGGSRDIAILWDPATYKLYVLESGILSATANMSWETDWLLLAGDFQDRVVLRDVMLSARKGSNHGATIKVYTNYSDTPTTTLTWTATEINTVLTNLGGGSRYTLKGNVVRQDTRAVKLVIEETADTGVTPRDGMLPIACTLLYSVTDATNESAFVQGARK